MIDIIKKIVKSVFVFLFIIVISFKVVCSQDNEIDYSKDTIVINIPYAKINFDNSLPMNYTSLQILNQISETLVNYDIKNGFIPNLAESWQVSPDNKEWVFKLRKVKFQDETFLDSACVKMNFERIISANKRFKGWGYAFLNPLFFLDKIDIPDRQTVKFIFKKPYPNLLRILSMPQFVILSKNSLSDENVYLNHPSGCGPFRFIESRIAERVVLERFDDYYGKKSFVRRIVFELIQDEDLRILSLKKEMSDIAVVSDLFYIEQKQKLNNEENIMLNCNKMNIDLFFNTHSYPFNELRFRKAFADMINVNRFYFYGLNVKEPSENKKNIDIYNEKNKDFIKIINSSMKKNTEIKILIQKFNDLNIPSSEKICEGLSKILNFFKIKYKIIVLDDNVIEKQLRKGNYNIVIYGTSENTLLKDCFYYLNLSQYMVYDGIYNKSFYRNDKVGRILSDDLTVNMQDNEIESSQLRDILSQGMPFFNIYKIKLNIIYKKHIKCLNVNSFGIIDMKKILLFVSGE